MNKSSKTSGGGRLFSLIISCIILLGSFLAVYFTVIKPASNAGLSPASAETAVDGSFTGSSIVVNYLTACYTVNSASFSYTEESALMLHVTVDISPINGSSWLVDSGVTAVFTTKSGNTGVSLPLTRSGNVWSGSQGINPNLGYDLNSPVVTFNISMIEKKTIDFSGIIDSDYEYTITNPYQNDSFIQDDLGGDVSGGCYGWRVTSDGKIKSTNEGIADSYSGFLLSVTTTEEAVLSITFYLSADSDSTYLEIYDHSGEYSLIDYMDDYSVAYDDYVTVRISLSQGTSDIGFYYIKFGDTVFGNDSAYISNIQVKPPVYRTITLDNQGATTAGTTSVSVAEWFDLPSITAPTKTGYGFIGYYTSTNGSGTRIYKANGTPAISTSTFTTDTTLYAYWEPKRTITLDNQGATTAGTTIIIVAKGESLPSIAPPTKTGYAFFGYYTSTNGSGTKIYNASGTRAIATSTFTADTTLYAYWVQKRTIILDNQGATTAGTASVSVAKGESFPSITAPTKTGYVFGGYCTEVNGNGTKIYRANGTPAISTSTFTANTTLYACWLDTNIGRNITSCFDYTITNPYSGRYSDSKYSWVSMDSYMKSTNEGVKNSSSGFKLSFTASSDAVLIVTYKVSSDSASYDYLEIKSSNSAVSWSKVGGTSMTAFTTKTLPIVSGENVWEFYYRKNSYGDEGDDCAYISSIQIKIPVYRTITLDNQGATTAGTTSVSVAEGGDLPSITAPTKTGYAFFGYYTSTNGSGTKIYNANGTSAISTSTFTADTTLYAYWEQKRTITLNNQGATTAGTTSVSVAKGESLSSITVPTKTGYVFGGYYTSTNGGGTKIYNVNGTPAISTSTFTANTTLYACWLDTNIGRNITSCFDYTITNPYSGRYSDSTYSWASTDSYMKSTNEGVKSSRSGFKLSFTASSEAVLEITYRVSSESASYDYLEIKSSNSAVSWSNVGGTSMTAFETKALPIVSGENVWEFYYHKDNSQDKGDDCAYISSIKIKAVVSVALDNQFATTAGTISISVAEGLTLPTITAPTKTGYRFGGYYTAQNGKGTKIYNANGTPAISASTFIADTTLYAYWHWYEIASITGSTTQYSDYSSIDDEGKFASLTITPTAGHIISQFSFDNTNWYTVAYIRYDISNTTMAVNVAYYANENSNSLVIEFTGIITNASVKMYLKTVSGAYSGLKIMGGSVDGVAVQSTYGGVAMIVGANFAEMTDDDYVICSTMAIDNYAFMYWMDESGNKLSYDESAKFKKKDVYGSMLTAVFAPVGTDPNTYTVVDNSE